MVGAREAEPPSPDTPLLNVKKLPKPVKMHLGANELLNEFINSCVMTHKAGRILSNLNLG